MVDAGVIEDGTRAEDVAALLDVLRARTPQVHALTSTVAQNLTANILLAVGAQPSMSQAPGEIEAFAERTDALLVNLGMLDTARRDGIARALPILNARRVAWVLDPVKVERSPARATYAQDLLNRSPAIIRVNGEEARTLSGWALPPNTTLVETGAVDRVWRGARAVSLANGHAYQGYVTAMGCAGTSLLAAYLTVTPDPFTASIAGLTTLNVAAEIAAERSHGPGSFVPALLDALYHLKPDALLARARIA